MRRQASDLRLPSVKAHWSITTEEAERAVYIDVEMRVKEPPALIGVQIEDVLDQVVLDPRLAPAARRKGLSVFTFDEVIEGILKRCKREKRVLVAYSQHERELIFRFLGIDVGGLYRDAHKIVRRWKNKYHPDWDLEDNGLKAFLKAIGYERPAYLGESHAAQWLGEVTDMLARVQRYADLTDKKKAAWTKLLHHNQIDCDGMRELVLLAASESSEV